MERAFFRKKDVEFINSRIISEKKGTEFLREERVSITLEEPASQECKIVCEDIQKQYQPKKLSFKREKIRDAWKHVMAENYGEKGKS